MEIYRHKASGKYFIFIEYAGNDSALFVNPIAKIMELELSQFDDDSLENISEYFVHNSFITEEQAQRSHIHQEFRKQDEEAKQSAEFEALVEGMSKEELNNLLQLLEERLKKSE